MKPIRGSSTANRRSITRRVFCLGALVFSVIGFGCMLSTIDFFDSLGGELKGRRLERIQRSPNFRDGVFQNPVKTTMLAPGGAFEVMKEWMKNRDRRVPRGPLPSIAVTRDSFLSPPADNIRVCWLGHSTVLMEIEGRRILFDPVWANRSSPSTLVGPARFQPSPLPIDQVPELSAVVITHDHYDHLDRIAIQTLAKAASRMPFFMPLGVGAHLESWGVGGERIHELDWWEETTLAEGHLRLIAAPARHFSGRGPFDRNKTQWCSWVVIGHSKRAYFGGDGGYYPGFVEIGRRFGPFDLTMLEIGAYHPNWGQIHLGPEMALRAQRDLAGRYLLPIHWGTFNLALHAWDEPIKTLTEHAHREGITLLVPKLGQVVSLSDAPPVTYWWKEGT